MLIEAAMNGDRTPNDHPAVPVNAETQAAEAKAAGLAPAYRSGSVRGQDCPSESERRALVETWQTRKP